MPLRRPARWLGRVPVLMWALAWTLVWTLTTPQTGHAEARAGVWPLEGVSGLQSVEVWYDRGGDATLDDARLSGLWEPGGAVMMGGYRPGAMWLRVAFTPAPPPPARGPSAPAGAEAGDGAQDRWLRVGSGFLDDVRYYRPDGQGAFEAFLAGDAQGAAGRGRTDRVFVFPVPAADAGQAPAVAFVRVASASALSVRLDVVETHELPGLVGTEFLTLGLYSGVLLVIVLWGTAQAVAYREQLSALFALYLLASLLLTWSMAGFAGGWFGTAANTVDNALSLLTTTLALAFHRAFMMEFGMPRGVIRATNLLVAGCVCNAALLLTGQTAWALQLNAWVIAVSGLLALPLLLLVFFRPAQAGNRLALAGYVLLDLIVLLSIFPVLGLMEPHPLLLILSLGLAPYTALLFGGLILQRRMQLQRDVVVVREEFRSASAEAAEMRAERDEKERFLSMLVHELRTPLSVIRLVLEGLMARPEGRTRSVEHARRSVDDINRVIDRAVQVDQVERGTASPVRITCALQPMVERIAEEFEEGSRVRCVAAGDAPAVDTDPVLLGTILQNLIGNALKYSAPGSRISVDIHAEARQRKPGVALTVRNRPGAAGFPDPEQLFRKYYRSDGARRSSGSGLGLYLVAGLAQALGGEVRYRPGNSSAIDGDVAFELWLPL